MTTNAMMTHSMIVEGDRAALPTTCPTGRLPEL
jgi:hypothetical protein